MLNNHLVTIQTPPEGVLVKKVMVAEAVDIVKETYFAILMDRASRGSIIIASPMGGVDIEAVAKNYPEKMFIVSITKDAETRDEASCISFIFILYFYRQKLILIEA